MIEVEDIIEPCLILTTRKMSTTVVLNMVKAVIMSTRATRNLNGVIP